MVTKISGDIFRSLEATHRGGSIADLIDILRDEQPILNKYIDRLLAKYNIYENIDASQAVIMGVAGTYLAIKSAMEAEEMKQTIRLY
jgi:hypothetical protein